MKKILLFILLFYTLAGVSQTLTKKYNSVNNRYEYFDSRGNMVGYQFYDNLDKSWKYYEVPQKQQSTYVQPINHNRVNQALATKQGRYDANVQKIQNAIEDIADKIMSLEINESAKERISERFDIILNNLNASKYNYSNSTTTNNVINWMYNEINKAIKQETE
ncbi:hypothetical protein [Flavobacterium microcysteis]|uniref:Uncharacterized protein n=1 Tax=Flavobacterium microcysteis TaxID=2596891 RepID=A0A501QFU8_9FLAO|nr:hypothetical protein [Flavobacterium microcysteis]TPD71095.1 hypothetical protein FJA49_04130 [Flavobacterium microcysteis]